MSPRRPVNILIVDDQPAKLISLEAILSDMGETIIKAKSADEALKHLLATDIAVVLVDVCMPQMDGFALAELIRGHPRFRRTAILFISAIALADSDRLKAYDLGAMDYIPVPVVPEVLRAKVAVFVELYRKTVELEELNRQLEARVAERTADLEATNARLRTSQERYRYLVQSLPAAVYTCDADGRVTLYNAAAVELWGSSPEQDNGMWYASLKFFNPDGTPLPPDERPMAITLREGRPVRGREVILERPDGTRRNVLPHPEPILDSAGKLVGAINMLVDVTEQREAQRAQVLLSSIVASSQDAIISKTLDGRITSWNAGAQLMYGYSAEEAIGQPIQMLIPPDRRHEEQAILKRLRAGQSVQMYDTVRVAKDGRLLDVSLAVSPLRDSTGRIVGASKVARDITERKRAEAVLARDRETLEKLVAERTAELERSNDRLRLADRMATIGTLSAGLGHDMGNLLLPVRMRLDAIERCELPGQVKEDIAAIRKATEYLQRLAGSLRLLALDPSTEPADDAATDLAEWWAEAEGMIRNGVHRPAVLSAQIPPDLPQVRIGKAGLAQVVFNLVQNAGDALAGRMGGQILVRAALSASGQAVEISVIDNGPGMSAEAKRRCMEPFFTTKPRGLSTGLGLALVGGIIKRVRGSIDIQTQPEKGTTFRVILPVAHRAPQAQAKDGRRKMAVVTVADGRLLAHVHSVLTALSFDVRQDGKPGEADLWVVDGSDASALEAARRFAFSAPERRALVFGQHDGVDRDNGHGGKLMFLEPRLKPSQLRAQIRIALSRKTVTTGDPA